MPTNSTTTKPTSTSTPGPRTEEGKTRSAQNSLRHGLTGAGKFLPSELAAEVESRKTEFAARFAPRDSFATFLVGQLALASVRIENCQRLEQEMTDHLLQSSDSQAATDRCLDAFLLYNRIDRDPPSVRLQLLQTAAGRDILLRKLANLVHGLTSGRCAWTNHDVTRALDLLGFSREERHLEPEAIAFKRLADLARHPSIPLEDRKAAGTALFERLKQEIENRRQEAPDPALEKNQQSLRSSGRWFENHNDLKRLRRYEAAATRLFFKTLNLLEAEPEPTPAEISPPSSAPDPAPTPEPTPSSRPHSTPYPEKSLEEWLSPPSNSRPQPRKPTPSQSASTPRTQKQAATLRSLQQQIAAHHRDAAFLPISISTPDPTNQPATPRSLKLNKPLASKELDPHPRPPQ